MRVWTARAFRRRYKGRTTSNDMRIFSPADIAGESCVENRGTHMGNGFTFHGVLGIDHEAPQAASALLPSWHALIHAVQPAWPMPGRKRAGGSGIQA